MKVVVTLSIEVDEEEWCLSYGEMSKTEVRGDVKQYFKNTAANLHDAFSSVEVR